MCVCGRRDPKSGMLFWRVFWVRFIMQTQGVAAMRRAVFMLGSRQSVRAAKDKISWSKGVSGTLNSGLKEEQLPQRLG